MAAVCHWFEFWKNYLDSHRVYSHCCIFSGGLIYAKVLLKCLESRVTNPLIMEMSFTGMDYYCEFQYKCIPNNSNIKYSNYYFSKIVENNFIERQRSEHKAINKLRMMNNKNVTQPSELESTYEKINNNEKNVLILGQVINDFSILETDLDEYNIFLIYKEAILNILNKTEHNIIFKAHPWENKKINIYRSLTKDLLCDFLNSLSYEQKERVRIVENYNLKKLFDNCSYVVTLCSQGGIEAAYHGLKTIQLGKAFYGEKGFTYDVNAVEDIVPILLKHSGFLSISEFNAYKQFLVTYLLDHLISNNPSGQINLRKLFSPINRIKLLPPNSAVKPLNSSTISPPKAIVKTNGQIANANTAATVPIPKATTPPKKVVVSSDSNVERTVHYQARLVDELKEVLASSGNKFSKLKHNPERFFSDSKYKSIRKIGHLYKAMKQD